MWTYIHEYEFEDKKIQYEFIVSPEKKIYLLKRRVKETSSDFYILDKNYLTNKNSNITKRVYYIVQCIQNLKIGKIKKYQIFYKLELDVISRFLESKNISSQILFKSFGANLLKLKYVNYLKNKSDLDDMYFHNTSSIYLDRSKTIENIKMYVVVYKGYINIIENKDNVDLKTEKFKIYLRE
jgi:hypothetical protein